MTTLFQDWLFTLRLFYAKCQQTHTQQASTRYLVVMSLLLWVIFSGYTLYGYGETSCAFILGATQGDSRMLMAENSPQTATPAKINTQVCQHLNHLLGHTLSNFKSTAQPDTQNPIKKETPVSERKPSKDSSTPLKTLALQTQEALQNTERTLEARITQTKNQWLIDTQPYRYWILLSPSWLNTSPWEQPQKGMRAKVYEWLYDQPMPQQNITQWLTWALETHWKIYRESITPETLQVSNAKIKDSAMPSDTEASVEPTTETSPIHMASRISQVTSLDDVLHQQSNLTLIESGTSVTSFPMDLYTRLTPEYQINRLQSVIPHHARQIQLDIEHHWRIHQVPLKPLRILERLRQEVKYTLK